MSDVNRTPPLEQVKTDCRHFPLDRPCRLQKESQARCRDCSAYEPVSAPTAGGPAEILIVKLGAMGDVLRTTFLLPGLREAHPGARITWITAPASVRILEGNPYLHEVWPQDGRVFDRLAAARFDMVVNLDLSPASLSLATLATTRRRVGYWLGAGRAIRSSNVFARRWLAMSAYDDLKKANTHTYQYWMAKIVGLSRADYEIHTPLLPASAAKARAFAARSGLGQGRPVVGVNPGAGKRWKLKKWTDSGYAALIRRLSAAGHAVLLLGGADEKPLVEKLASRTGAISAGTGHSLPDFFAMLDLCDLLVTGDTLAMHAALGLGKKVVAVFGPTSASEIELYGRGTKVVSPAPCVCCYRQTCDVRPDCMKRIPVSAVWDAVTETLEG